MKRAWLVGVGAAAVLGLVVIGQTEGYAGHGHSGGTHAAKETHEAPKHNSKPAPHPAPKPPSKSPSKPQSKAPKPLPKPSVHNQEHSHSNAAEHSSNLKHPNAITSNPNSQKTAKNETTHTRNITTATTTIGIMNGTGMGITFTGLAAAGWTWPTGNRAWPPI